MCLQERLHLVLGNFRVVQMLLPPPLRTCHGTWLLGLEQLLTELPPKDSTAAIGQVSSCTDQVPCKL